VTAPAYTRQAIAAITRAARAEHDFSGWLAQVLAAAAGQLGSSDELIIGRPGSWEASFVDQLVKGTVGYGDEYLPGPSGRAKLTDGQVRQIRDRHAYDDVTPTRRQLAAEFGVHGQRHRHRQDLAVAGVIANGQITPGVIPRNMCQPPVMEPHKLIKQLSPADLETLVVTMAVWVPEAFEMGLKRVSENRAGGAR
jgi:hypothetical protein